MKLTVPITREVEVHVHKYSLRVRWYGTGPIRKPDYSLICICGNGMGLKSEEGTRAHDDHWHDEYISLTEMLETAAIEQERKHQDWTEE
jgi:hypothetical protein